MCGINGLYQFNGRKVDASAFDAMTDSLAHRGPDGRGVFTSPDQHLYLGHRRLKILDLSERGKQPMPDPTKRYWITFNGEIYNFIELRAELERMGHSFVSHSDTEVILAAYREWGSACQLKLNGMWAFGIWDSIEKTLFLSRDRFGVKPLFYLFDEQKLAFASELKGFLHLSDFEIEFDEEKIATCLRDTSILEQTPYTYIKGIRRLQAGHSLTFSIKRGLKIERWWNTLNHLVSVPSRFEEQTAQFKELFEDACRIRMRSDVPIGCALSGGLDSSSILGTLSALRSRNQNLERISRAPLKAFVALFPGIGEDELPYAKKMIDETQVDARVLNIDSSLFLDHFDECLFQHEEIFELPIGPWAIYREFRKENTIISLDGHGGDELLGGYQHHVQACLYQSLFPIPRLSRFRNFSETLNALYSPNCPLPQTSVPRTFINAILHEMRNYPQFQFALRSLYRKGKQILQGKAPFEWIRYPVDRSTYEVVSQFLPRNLGGLNRLLYEDFHLRTLPAILRNFDRASMAHGIEIRAPFLDWRLVSYCFSLPPEAKIHGGWTKRILRESMKGTLPEFVRQRKSKIGFTSPFVKWIGSSFKPFILDSVSSQDFLDSPIWNGPEINRFVQNSYKSGDLQGVRRAWECIQACHLMKLFKKVKV